MSGKDRAPRNKTMTLSSDERATYETRLHRLAGTSSVKDVLDKTICQDLAEVLPFFPAAFADLLILDPPYNIDKRFGRVSFAKRSDDRYEAYLDAWVTRLLPCLTKTASVYVCGDWQSTSAIYRVLSRRLTVRNRIVWEREKGRGAKTNWKNTTEDIWFATVGKEYTFNVDCVKMKRRVVAPYRTNDGVPKDWQESDEGNFRLTHPSNFWTDISVPYWSMAENTPHPTQKAEKLIAKLILASSNVGDVVFDPFLGSGTTSVVAKKLGRRYVGVEVDREYALFAEKRLALADAAPSIQGYVDGVFWERNTSGKQARALRTVKNETVR